RLPTPQCPLLCPSTSRPRRYPSTLSQSAPAPATYGLPATGPTGHAVTSGPPAHGCGRPHRACSGRQPIGVGKAATTAFTQATGGLTSATTVESAMDTATPEPALRAANGVVMISSTTLALGTSTKST